MDEVAESLAATIGQRVKQERRARGWTLDNLAATAGVSRRMVINVEQGTTNPSVGTLLKLSEALRIGLPTLVAPPEPHRASLVRRGGGAVLWTGESGGQGVLVASAEPPDVVELWEWTMQPGEEHPSDAHTKGTQELLQVHEGSLTVTVADRTVELNTGDALRFAGDVPHSYANHGDATARFSLAVYEPEVGSGRRSEATRG